MAGRVFVKVVGFSDVERHALNSVFRLSVEHGVAYALWAPDGPPASLALMDGLSYEAPMALAMPGLEDLKLIWIGPGAPPQAWRRFERPLAWPEILAAMDELFAPAPDIDFDLDADADIGPATQPPEPQALPKRALIASASREERLYLRARLALAQLPLADEAETAAQVLELIRSNSYVVTLVDFALPDGQGWGLVKQLAQSPAAAGRVIVTKTRPTLPEKLMARLGGAQALFDKPPPPTKLSELLEKV